MSSSEDQQAIALDKAREGLAAIIAGNARFADGAPTAAPLTPQERERLLQGQDPIAVVLGCVDARVPPSLILDQRVGDLLAIRTAGQSLAGVALGSIEFGVRVLGVPLVVVLGHTGCGAVLAALKDDHADGHLGEMTGEVADRLSQITGNDPVRATGANLAATVQTLRSMGTLITPDGVEAHVVGMLYDMATGFVSLEDDAGLTTT